MYSIRQAASLFSKLPLTKLNKELRRNVKVSIIGADNETGSKVALLLKLNYKVTHIKLYDKHAKIKGDAAELNLLPGGPKVIGYSGDELGPAICTSDFILVISKVPKMQIPTKLQVLHEIAPDIQDICQAMASYNPKAFLVLANGPINSSLPFAAAFLHKYNQFNPFKLLGITSIDEARCKCLIGALLKANPTHLRVPVIGGHSAETLTPLLSNITPSFYTLDTNQADRLSRIVKMCGNEIKLVKDGEDSTLALAWSINEFCKGLIDIIAHGNEVELNCFAANPHFGTRYFAGPNIVGRLGIIKPPSKFKMSRMESNLLSDSIYALNEDIKLGEFLFASLTGAAEKGKLPADPRHKLVHNHLNSLR